MASNPLIVNELDGDGQWSDTLTVSDWDFSYTVTGTFDGTLTMQAATEWRDLDPVWIDIAEFEKPTAGLSYVMKGAWMVRIGFQAGGWVSGSAEVRLYRGEDENARRVVTKRIQ